MKPPKTVLCPPPEEMKAPIVFDEMSELHPMRVHERLICIDQSKAQQDIKDEEIKLSKGWFKHYTVQGDLTDYVKVEVRDADPHYPDEQPYLLRVTIDFREKMKRDAAALDNDMRGSLTFLGPNNEPIINQYGGPINLALEAKRDPDVRKQDFFLVSRLFNFASSFRITGV